MWAALKAMASSKKFLAAVISGLVWAGGKFGLQLDAGELLPIIAPLWGYIFGVALEDHGKAKAKIEAGSGTPAEPTA